MPPPYKNDRKSLVVGEGAWLQQVFNATYIKISIVEFISNIVELFSFVTQITLGIN